MVLFAVVAAWLAIGVAIEALVPLEDHGNSLSLRALSVLVAPLALILLPLDGYGRKR